MDFYTALKLALAFTFISQAYTQGCFNNAASNNCLQWKSRGYCTHAGFKDYMKKNCAKLCGFCKPTVCQNSGRYPDISCEAWKPYCGKNGVVTSHCEKTCGICTPATVNPTATAGPKPECGRTYIKQSRIVNGDDAKEGAWPWIASLQTNTGKHFCGGTLIHQNWVLTAAHCVSFMTAQNMNVWRVKLGAHNLKNHETSVQTFRIKRVISHPLYRRSTLMADMAVLELSGTATLNKRVQLVCLPKPGYPPKSATCYMAGWGYTSYPGKTTHLLQQAQLPLVDSSYCKWQREVVCVGLGTETGTNACRGDSGGPLMCRKSDGKYELHGVASYVYKYCSHYTGYAPVNKYLAFIKKYVPGV